jgi:hypothetical protein
MFEPRTRRGAPALSLQQKIQRFLERCISMKPLNGKSDIGMCKCHPKMTNQIYFPGRGMIRVTRALLFLAGRITEWQMWNSPKYVLHACGNPFCFNVTHLRMGTHGENVIDMVRDKSQPMVLDRKQIRLLWTEYFILGNHDFYKLWADPRFRSTPKGANHPRRKKRLHPMTLYSYIRGNQQQLVQMRATWFRQQGLTDPYA